MNTIKARLDKVQAALDPDAYHAPGSAQRVYDLLGKLDPSGEEQDYPPTEGESWADWAERVKVEQAAHPPRPTYIVHLRQLAQDEQRCDLVEVRDAACNGLMPQGFEFPQDARLDIIVQQPWSSPRWIDFRSWDSLSAAGWTIEGQAPQCT